MVIVYATDNYWPRISGMAVSIETFKTELENRGHEMHVLCPDYAGAGFSDLKMNRTNIHRFASYELSFLLNTEDSMVHLFEKKSVTATLDAIRPDLIHVQTEFTMGRFASEYARKRHIPLVMTSHTHFEEYIKIYFPYIPDYISSLYVRTRSRLTFNRSDILLVPTAEMKKLHLRNGVRVPIDVLPTGIDAELFRNPDASAAARRIKNIYPDADSRKRLLYAGRLGIEKNLHFLLDAVSEIRKTFPDVVLFIIGEGPVRTALEHVIKQKGLEDNICFLGYVPHEEIKHYFAYCDVFTFPSKTETQGLVTVEAMMCGTPVVGIGEMGTLSVMQGDNGGFMVGDDLAEFCSRTIELLSDSKLHRAKSAEAVKYSEKFTIERLAVRLEEIYRETRNSKRARLLEWLACRSRSRKFPAAILKKAG